MAWSFVGLGTIVEAASGNLVLVEPVGVQPGDLMVAMIGFRGSTTFSLPASWNNLDQTSGGNTSTTPALAIGCVSGSYIIRGGSAPALTWTRTSGDVARGAIGAWRNDTAGAVIELDQADANNPASPSTNRELTGWTPVESGELVIIGAGGGDDSSVSNYSGGLVSGLSAFSEVLDSSTTTGADTTVAMAWATQENDIELSTFSLDFAVSSRHSILAATFRAKYQLFGGAQGSSAVTSGDTESPAGVAHSYLGTSAVVIVDPSHVRFPFDIGAAPDVGDVRLISVHLLTADDFAGSDIDAVTINGFAATRLDVGTSPGSFRLYVYYAFVPTGSGVVDVIVTGNATMEAGGIENYFQGATAYRFTGLDPDVPIYHHTKSIKTTGVSNESSVDVPQYGVVVAGVMGPFVFSATSTTWEGLDEDLSTQLSYDASIWSAGGDISSPGLFARMTVNGGTPFLQESIMIMYSVPPAEGVVPPVVGGESFRTVVIH